MGIYRRPDSPFWWMLLERPERTPLRLSTGIPVDGGTEPQSKSLRAQAQQVYALKMGDLVSGRWKLPGARERRTFAEHRVWYATHISAHKRGTTREVSMLKQLAAFFDRYDLIAIDHPLAREWRTQRLEDVSASTVRREEELLKHLLTTAVPKYLESNPLVGLQRLRVAVPDTRVLTVEEERALLATLPRPEAYALVVCALDTLLRLRNVADLLRRQDHRTYLYSDTKTGAVKIPISARLRKALDALPGDGAHYFPSYALKSNNAVITMFVEACARARVQTGRKTGGISFHCLRHTGASRMLDAGADVKTVMEIGGWKNLAVMSRYLHPTEARKREAVEMIGGSHLVTRGSRNRDKLNTWASTAAKTRRTGGSS